MSEPTAIEPDQHPSDPAWAGPGDNMVQQVRARPIVAAVTLLLLVLLILDLFGFARVDAWAIVLLVLILLPWSLPATLGLMTSLSDAFREV